MVYLYMFIKISYDLYPYCYYLGKLIKSDIHNINPTID